MTKALKIVLTSFAITAGLIKGAPTLAQPVAGDVNVNHVRTADLDLSTDAGRRALDLRLSQAAREVCGSASDADLEGKNDVRECRDDVLARAQVKRDALLAAGERGSTITLAAKR